MSIANTAAIQAVETGAIPVARSFSNPSNLSRKSSKLPLFFTKPSAYHWAGIGQMIYNQRGSKMIGVYVRVSSLKQDTASQEQDLRGWANGKDGVSWYQDVATGKNMDRPGFQRLLADVRLGKIKTIVVWRLDRLGRTASGLTGLFDELIAKGVNLVSLKDGIDLSTAAGKLMANIIASIAAYETEIRGERIQAGLNAKREAVAAGLDTWNAGRPKGTPNKATPDVCEAVKEQVAKGINKSKVAKMFNLSRPTVYAILKGAAA